MVGLGRGAHYGILIKTGDGLEAIPTVDTIIFDKTGTLTVGRPEVTYITTANDYDTDSALKLIASVEKNSNHPIAEALVNYATDKNLTLSDSSEFQEVPGKGARAIVQGKKILVGNCRLMNENGVSLETLSGPTQMLQEQGSTVVYAAVDGRPLCVCGLADTIKETSVDAVMKLQQSGIEVWMLTGDRRETAEVIAQKTGITNILSEVLPGDKATKVRDLQEEGRRVAMVGDGINDAPALAQADVGIALGSGTDVSVETGDIVLVRDDLLDVVSAIELGKRTMTKIKQGFFWAMIYNIILIPIAMGLLFPSLGLALRPEFAGLAMSMSSVSVVTNALLLNRFKPSRMETSGESALEPEVTEPTVAIDPICKMDVDIPTAKLVSEYKGKKYYFCAQYCKDTFEADPAKYEGQDVRVS
jgi:Cu+-exporting ATPase